MRTRLPVGSAPSSALRLIAQTRRAWSVLIVDLFAEALKIGMRNIGKGCEAFVDGAQGGSPLTWR